MAAFCPPVRAPAAVAGFEAVARGRPVWMAGITEAWARALASVERSQDVFDDVFRYITHLGLWPVQAAVSGPRGSLSIGARLHLTYYLGARLHGPV